MVALLHFDFIAADKNTSKLKILLRREWLLQRRTSRKHRRWCQQSCNYQRGNQTFCTPPELIVSKFKSGP